MIDIFAQLHFYRKAVMFLLQTAKEVDNLSRVLLLYLSVHDHEDCISQSVYEECPVQLLLRMRADPNATDYVTTALHIAVRCRDLNAVGQLLRAGADPNATGNHYGNFWGADTLQEPSNALLGEAPLVSDRKCCSPAYNDDFKFEPDEAQRIENARQIDEVLIQYGARERSCPRNPTSGIPPTDLW